MRRFSYFAENVEREGLEARSYLTDIAEVRNPLDLEEWQYNGLYEQDTEAVTNNFLNLSESIADNLAGAQTRIDMIGSNVIRRFGDFDLEFTRLLVDNPEARQALSLVSESISQDVLDVEMITLESTITEDALIDMMALLFLV